MGSAGRFLVAICRQPDDPADPRSPIWTPLEVKDVKSVKDPLRRAFGIVSSAFRAKLRPLVEEMSRRVEGFTQQCGPNSQLSALSSCMVEAFERLDFPSTTRDLIRQTAAVQRFWLLADA